MGKAARPGSAKAQATTKAAPPLEGAGAEQPVPTPERAAQSAEKPAQTAPGQGAAAAQRRQAARAAAMAQPAYPRPRGTGPDWGRLPFPVTRPCSAHGQVTAVSMMKDEGPYVLEWVAHHLALGFSDLVVYTNDCSDGTDDMLIRLEQLGLVHHRRNVIPPGLRPQPSALTHAEAEPVVQLSDWVMVFDADEFLSIRHGDGSLEGLLTAAKAEGANGIVITWRIFGSGGVVDWSRAPVTEQYLQAAPIDWNKGWGVKTLFQYDPEVWKLGIHRPKLKTKVLKTDFPDRVRWLNGSGQPMEEYFTFRGWRSITRTVGYDWAQLNHYAVKSVDSYALRKLRGNVNNKADKYNGAYWALQDRNEIRDDTMLRYSPRRAALIAALLADPELKRLHEAALEQVEARLEALRPTPAYGALRAELAAASQVPIGAIVAKPPQARDPAKIAALMSDVERLRSAQARADRKSAARLPEEAPPGAALGLRASGPAAPAPLYVAPGPAAPPEGAVPQDTAPALPPFLGDWVENQDVALPLDDRIFAAPALALVARGKFERGLARHLPALLPHAGRVLELGAATGFLALLLARRRPDLTLIVQEEDPLLQQAFGWVSARNAARTAGGVVLDPTPLAAAQDPAAALAELLLRHRPDVLLLGAPPLAWAPGLAATLAALAELAGGAPGAQAPGPDLLLWHGRALVPALAPDLTAELGRLGYAPMPPLTPGLVGMRRAAASA